MCWDSHHCDSFWHSDVSAWPWSNDCCHLSCPLRHLRRSRQCWTSLVSVFDSDFDFDKFCTDTFSPHWHSTHWHKLSSPDTLLTSSPWCHRSCLTGVVTLETGDEPNSMGKGTFKVVVDVHHFRPDELTLKVRNHDTIVLQGKQSDERANNKALSCIAREFTRRYKLPRRYDATQATASLSTDGMLTILVPAPPPLDDVERVLEIQQTGFYYGRGEKKALEAGEKQEEEEQKETKSEEAERGEGERKGTEGEGKGTEGE